MLTPFDFLKHPARVSAETQAAEFDTPQVAATRQEAAKHLFKVPFYLLGAAASAAAAYVIPERPVIGIPAIIAVGLGYMSFLEYKDAAIEAYVAHGFEAQPGQDDYCPLPQPAFDDWQPEHDRL